MSAPVVGRRLRPIAPIAAPPAPRPKYPTSHPYSAGNNHISNNNNNNNNRRGDGEIKSRTVKTMSHRSVPSADRISVSSSTSSSSSSSVDDFGMEGFHTPQQQEQQQHHTSTQRRRHDYEVSRSPPTTKELHAPSTVNNMRSLPPRVAINYEAAKRNPSMLQIKPVASDPPPAHVGATATNASSKSRSAGKRTPRSGQGSTGPSDSLVLTIDWEEDLENGSDFFFQHQRTFSEEGASPSNILDHSFEDPYLVPKEALYARKARSEHSQMARQWTQRGRDEDDYNILPIPSTEAVDDNNSEMDQNAVGFVSAVRNKQNQPAATTEGGIEVMDGGNIVDESSSARMYSSPSRPTRSFADFLDPFARSIMPSLSSSSSCAPPPLARDTETSPSSFQQSILSTIAFAGCGGFTIESFLEESFLFQPFSMILNRSPPSCKVIECKTAPDGASVGSTSCSSSFSDDEDEGEGEEFQISDLYLPEEEKLAEKKIVPEKENLSPEEELERDVLQLANQESDPSRDLDKAQTERVYWKVLVNTRLATYGLRSVRTASAVMELGKAHLNSHDYVAAEKVFDVAYRIFQQVNKPLGMAQALDRLAWCYTRTGRASTDPSKPPLGRNAGKPAVDGTRDGYSQALTALDEAIQIRYHELGPWHVDTVDTMNKIAAVHMQFNHFEEARNCFWQVFGVRQAIFGPEHPSVAVAAHAMAGCLCRLGATSQAKHYFQTAMDIYNRMELTPKNPSVVKLLRDMKRMQLMEHKPAVAATATTTRSAR